ncbi:hypothetical protein GWK47_044485 [Chionoecetes opilio]|uniref:Uncharacterized protein n=1 Tax=Chionoecetes opilio TaxID=41210 RepID=A0A8J4YJ57_CHIOP|nr:hypothetical protein GWK47_044485 [Chionoecetes opilio]
MPISTLRLVRGETMPSVEVKHARTPSHETKFVALHPSLITALLSPSLERPCSPSSPRSCCYRASLLLSTNADALNLSRIYTASALNHTSQIEIPPPTCRPPPGPH